MQERFLFPSFDSHSARLPRLEKPKKKSYPDLYSSLLDRSGLDAVHFSNHKEYAHHILSLFKHGMQEVRKATGEKLPLKGRKIHLTDRNNIKPKSDEEREYWRANYGDDGKSNISICHFNPDGTFLLEISVTKAGKPIKIGEILDELTHEYGHTLSKYTQPFEDEIKAYAFTHLYYRVMETTYSLKTDGSSSLHDEAKKYIRKLHAVGIEDEAIIAYITKRPFAGFIPQSYKKALQ